jgi:membrane protein implicated in regulation of membrane protease activity
MHGDDLPNLLSAVSAALTVVVVVFAWRTVREAKRTTAEEKRTVGELTKLLAA